MDNQKLLTYNAPEASAENAELSLSLSDGESKHVSESVDAILSETAFLSGLKDSETKPTDRSMRIRGKLLEQARRRKEEEAEKAAQKQQLEEEIAAIRNLGKKKVGISNDEMIMRGKLLEEARKQDKDITSPSEDSEDTEKQRKIDAEIAGIRNLGKAAAGISNEEMIRRSKLRAEIRAIRNLGKKKVGISNDEMIMRGKLLETVNGVQKDADTEVVALEQAPSDVQNTTTETISSGETVSRSPVETQETVNTNVESPAAPEDSESQESTSADGEHGVTETATATETATETATTPVYGKRITSEQLRHYERAMQALDQHIHFLWDEMVAARRMVSDSQNGVSAMTYAEEVGITSTANRMAEHRNAFLEVRERLKNQREFTEEDLQFMAQASALLLTFREEVDAAHQAIQALEVARRQDTELLREKSQRLETMNRPVGWFGRAFRFMTGHDAKKAALEDEIRTLQENIDEYSQIQTQHQEKIQQLNTRRHDLLIGFLDRF